MSLVNESVFLESGKEYFGHNIRSYLVQDYDELILNLRAIFGKEEQQEKRYFHVKEAGFGRYLVLAFIEKRDIEDDLLFLAIATSVTSSIGATIAKQQN
ncbi:Uncharacterized protein LW93_3351 [Fusarium fujikuroi]|nr:Uncharacterized protein LW93_3351 [Fusarium fujikuroi]